MSSGSGFGSFSAAITERAQLFANVAIPEPK